MHLLTLLLELPVRFCPQANQVSLTLVGSQLETQPFSRAPSSLPGPTGLGMVAQEGCEGWEEVGPGYLLLAGDAGALEGTHPQNMKMVLDEGS